jgi:hypothetical protein
MSTKTQTKKTRKPAARKRGAHTKDSASDTVQTVAKECKTSYRRARRVARKIGLGVGKGSTYNTLSKGQVNKLRKALA